MSKFSLHFCRRHFVSQVHILIHRIVFYGIDRRVFENVINFIAPGLKRVIDTQEMRLNLNVQPMLAPEFQLYEHE